MTQPRTIDEFGRRLRAGEISSVEMTESCLAAIQRENARLNTFITITADEARRQAEQADRELASGHDRGPLHGVPISIKDIIDIRGVATTAASRVREGHVAVHDAPVVVNLRSAGAVFVGKTNLHEFAFGTTSEESAFGPARNPHDATRSPGGSSGGSAASIVAGMALASIGTDTGGSVRIPAAACGTVGLKPTLGEIPTDGVVPLSRTCDHVGPLTRSVVDAWLVYNALVGSAMTRHLTPAPLASLKFAVLRPYFCDVLDDDVRAAFDRAVATIRAAGAHVADTEIRHASDLAAIYLHIVLADAAAYHAATLDRQPDAYTPGVRHRLELGRYVLGEDYARALKGREILRREVDAALASYDALLLPTLPIVAPTIGSEMVRIGGREEPVRGVMLRLTQLFNVTGHPAVSLPCGPTADLPCGLQLVGRRDETELLLHVALAVESELHRQ